MTDPHLNAQQLFGLRRESVCVRGKKRRLSAGGSCRWKAPLLLSLFRQAESKTHPSVGYCGGGGEGAGISDAAKHDPKRRRTSSCNAAHSSSLIELCWGRGEGEWGLVGSVIGAWQSLISKTKEESLVNQRSFMSRTCS